MVARGLRWIGGNRYMWQQSEDDVGATAWKVDELGNRGLRGIQEIWKLRESGRFGRLGNTEAWEIREIRKNHYMWEKNKNLLKTPKRSGDWVIREIGGVREIRETRKIR